MPMNAFMGIMCVYDGAILFEVYQCVLCLH